MAPFNENVAEVHLEHQVDPTPVENVPWGHAWHVGPFAVHAAA